MSRNGLKWSPLSRGPNLRLLAVAVVDATYWYIDDRLESQHREEKRRHAYDLDCNKEGRFEEEDGSDTLLLLLMSIQSFSHMEECVAKEVDKNQTLVQTFDHLWNSVTAFYAG